MCNLQTKLLSALWNLEEEKNVKNNKPSCKQISVL